MRTDKIYHYTSIESLALILSFKKLRFTRLDRVDDISEAQTHAGVPFGQYFFVSCWTQEETDNIAQWKMYGSDMMGVRIELPVYPFRQIKLDSKPGITVSGDLTSPLATDDLYGRNYMIIPPVGEGNKFAGPVEYVDDVQSRYAALISLKKDYSGAESLTIEKMFDLPRFKSNVWAFQSEYRFSLCAMPILPYADGTPITHPSREQFESISSSFRQGRDPGISYIDVPMEPTVLEQMVIRIGPLCTAGGRKCVEALVKAFAPHARVEDSPLTGTVRAKGA